MTKCVPIKTGIKQKMYYIHANLIVSITPGLYITSYEYGTFTVKSNVVEKELPNGWIISFDLYSIISIR